MNTSPAIGQLAAALALAQKKYRAVTKDKNASIQSTKGSFRYSYADLATCVSAIKDALSDNGLAILQPVHADNGTVLVTTLLVHASGEWISEVMMWPVVSTDNRSIGSGITYARRHSLLAMVGAAATDEDDDGEQARGGDHDTAKVAERPTAPTPPKSPGVLLWERLLARDGKEAHVNWAKAAKKALGPTPSPAPQWTTEQAAAVEAILFPVKPEDAAEPDPRDLV